MTLWGSGLPYREFLYVEDLAEACIYLMNNYDALEIGELLNIGVGKDLQISELAEIIRDIVGYRGEIKWNKSMPDGTPRKLLDISKINKLGWKSKTDLKKGLELTYDFYLKKCDMLS